MVPMTTSADSPVPIAPADSPAPPRKAPGFARRAAQALRKAGSAVWRTEPSDAAIDPSATDRKVVSFSDLTDRLKVYMSSGDIQKVKAAFRFSDTAHLGQFRKSGEPYITHPIAVAKILAHWRMDVGAVQAALLHDVMEDSGTSKQDLAEQFGPAVAELVDGVSKLDRLNFASNAQAQAESFRKMLLAMARDVRVILIKLADRLHNVRTLSAVDRERQKRIARETLDIYAPIAHRLGLNEIYRELQEACFALLYPLRYRVLEKAVFTARGNRREVLKKIHVAVQNALARSKLRAEIFGREKTLFGIYRKMVEKRLSFSEVLDIYGFRVVLNSVPDCYLALGVLHGLYKPVPGKFKDYIAIPKVNGYQSLHTTLIGPFGQPVEFQLRTREMNRVAESGVAAHWLYKEDEQTLSDMQSRTHQWLQSLIELQQQTGDSAEFLENIKVDLFPDKVYIFTPKGKIVSLPRGATAVDFAYSIHTDIGNKCIAARINGEVQPLRTELRNGDVVEIVTGPVARPNPAWLGFVRSGRARAEIRHFLRTMKRQESVDLGARLLEQAAAQFSFNVADAGPEAWSELVREAQARDRDELLADVGLGRRLAAVLVRQLSRIRSRSASASDARASGPAPSAAPVQIQGTEGMALQMANCCTPIPGDEVVGQLRRDLGLVVHQSDCTHAQRARRADPDRWLDLQWSEDPVGLYAVNMDVRARNERGVLGYVAVAVAEAESNILSVNIEDEDAREVTIHFKIQVHDRRHLARVVRTLRRIRQVTRVARTRLNVRAQAPELPPSELS
ncbi:bifunctional (p)ppGpp synthetase II and guanosine-3',5'-bis pyrophosphate 3'-pyrophosphohydrolase [Burkholderiales bacterium]|nr:bifunctional (p)ppGpp synthetase II and guanosine-3',5'-bis pyrophosphate 3'-pyrophosphohydrolase [Burkholderiales bacterium]